MELFLLGTLVGMVVIFIIGAIRYTYAGLLRIHYDDESERPYLFLELNDDPKKTIRKKYVVFKVKEDSRQ